MEEGYCLTIVEGRTNKSKLNTLMDNFFLEIYQEFNLSSGDITPRQIQKIEHFKEEVLINFIRQNKGD